MEKLKFILFSTVALLLVGLIGYWSVVTLQSGTEHSASQKIEQLKKENEDLKTEVKKLTDELNVLQPGLEEPAPIVEKKTEPVVYKYQSLIDELQKLVKDNVFLKSGSKGIRVGTVQNFLNIYNNTSNKIDNDYGVSMKKTVTDFQKSEGVTADGEAGISTFNKMIDWLTKQV